MPFSLTSGYWVGSTRPAMRIELQTDQMPRIVDAVRRSIALDRPLVLAGPVGAGKSTWMREIDFWTLTRDRLSGSYNAAKSDRVRATWFDFPNWWTDADTYCKDVKDGWTRKIDEPRELYAADGIASQVKRLFFDDLGAEPQTDANREAIVWLLTDRHTRGLATWITTNLTEAQLEARYGERIMSRIGQSVLGWVTFAAGDWRRAA